MDLSHLGKVVLVGAGKMGMAMAKGWLKFGLMPDSLILVDPNPQKSVVEFAKFHGVSLFSEMPNIDVNVLILAVKPQIISAVMSSLKQKISPDVLVLSIIASTSINALSDGLGSKNIIRTMPNTPSQVGQGVTGVVAAKSVNEKNKQTAQALMAASGMVQWLDDESDLDALAFVSGCGPAYVFLLIEAMAKAGVEQGLKEDQAMALARQTVIGTATLMQSDDSDVKTLRKNVTSKGGITEAALSVLMAKDGFFSLFSKAFKKAKKRNEELAS